MKKTISVLLAIVLAFSFSSAFASRLDYQPGHGTIVKFDDFKATFTDFISEFKYNVEWSSGPRSKDGFEVYEARIARMDDGTLDMDVYTENGNVAYFDVYGSAYDDDAGNNLKWLLEKVKDTCYTVCGSRCGKLGRTVCRTKGGYEIGIISVCLYDECA